MTKFTNTNMYVSNFGMVGGGGGKINVPFKKKKKNIFLTGPTVKEEKRQENVPK